jgi:hypothetical protein
MRRFLALCTILCVFPAAQVRAETVPALSLTAPGATTFSHEVDFRGRLTPPTGGVRVKLMRGTTFLAAVGTGADGRFVIKAKVERPGPFHVEAAGFVSPDVTVRIVPYLDTELVGAQVAGSPLKLQAALRPGYAGVLRVRVERPGGKTFSKFFGSSAEVSLGTQEIERFNVVVQGIARPGFASVVRTLPVELRAPSLSYGSRSALVGEIVRRLHELGYAVQGNTNYFDDNVLQSVYAFQKVQGLDRDGVVGPAFWTRLDNPRLPKLRYTDPADHIEIDKTHQVLYIVRDGEIKLISPVSTAGVSGYYTPEGRFAIFRKVPGYDPSPLGILYRPMYFYGGYAIHGNPSVPAYPASHGCVRVPNFVIERLYTSEPYGETVYVY